jgi:hypothetical protein
MTFYDRPLDVAETIEELLETPVSPELISYLTKEEMLAWGKRHYAWTLANAYVKITDEQIKRETINLLNIATSRISKYKRDKSWTGD